MTKRKNFSEQYKVGAITDFQASGLTAAAFCRERGIPDSTFSVWHKRLTSAKKTTKRTRQSSKRSAKKDSSFDFLPVTLLQPKTNASMAPGHQQIINDSSLAVEIVLPAGGVFRFATNCPPAFLAAALAVMKVS